MMKDGAHRGVVGMGLELELVVPAGNPEEPMDPEYIYLEIGGSITQISLSEFYRYCDLFERMLSKLREEEESGWGSEATLDEFDLAEIAEFRERYL
jgi:hypothetical protein